MEIYKKGLKYCFFHGQDEIGLIDCPIDGSHQVLPKKLKQHLKKCNKIKRINEIKQNPFFQEKINNELEVKEKQKIITIQKEQPELFQKLIDYIPIAFEKAINQYTQYLQKLNIDTDNIKDYILDVQGDKNQVEISHKEKDLIQVELLCNLMRQYNLIDSDNIYVEYGAGKGRFSHQVAETLKQFSNHYACHVLIEREPRKQKYDKYQRKNPYYIRCRLDITDFNLHKLKEQIGFIKPFVGICKHMCGGATDLTLTSLLSQQQPIRGLAIATCCHHLCTLDTYKNPQFLQQIGFNENEAELMFQCSSWYVSGAINKFIADPVESQK
ncbi:hypothetical protein pb186bvf_008777 [Paramecium bursaria]